MKLHFAFLLTLVLIASMTGVSNATMILTDDFEDGMLDTSIWTALDEGNSSITESGGVVQLTNVSSDRAYLVTSGEWNPADGAVTITGIVNFTAGSSFEIWTRASNSYDSYDQPNGTGVLAGGIYLGYWLGADDGTIKYDNLSSLAKENDTMPWTAFGTETLTPTTGPTDLSWNFVVVDNGTTITATWTEVGDSTNVGKFVGTSSLDEGYYHIAFGAGNCELTDVAISQVPEPSSFALLLTLAGSLFLVRRR